MAAEISQSDLTELKSALDPLVGLPVEVLRLPRAILAGFEPSQIGTIVGTLMDACIPQLATLLPGILVQAAYSRELEQQADDDAIATLQRIGGDPARLADLLDRMGWRSATV